MLTPPRRTAHLVMFKISFSIDPKNPTTSFNGKNQTDIFSKSSNSQDHLFRAWRHPHSCPISCHCNLGSAMYTSLQIISAFIFIKRPFSFLSNDNYLSIRLTIYLVDIIMMSCCQHGSPWPSLATRLYRPLLPGGLQGYIMYRHRDAVYRF